MAFTTYVSDINKWKYHFMNDKQFKTPKDVHIIGKPKSVSDNHSIKVVSPTEQDVTKAKADIKREKSQVIKKAHRKSASMIGILIHLTPL